MEIDIYLHSRYGHIPYKSLINKFHEIKYYLNGVEILIEEYSRQCSECSA